MKFFPDGAWVSLHCAINGTIPAALADRPDGDQARNWAPLDANRLVGQWLGAGQDRLAIYDRRTGLEASVSPQPACYSVPNGGYTTIAAGGGVWGIQSSTNGMEASNGLSRPNGYLDDADDAGRLYTHEDFGQGMTGAVYDASGGLLFTIPGAWRLMAAQGVVLWMDVNRVWHVSHGTPLPAGTTRKGEKRKIILFMVNIGQKR